MRLKVKCVSQGKNLTQDGGISYAYRFGILKSDQNELTTETITDFTVVTKEQKHFKVGQGYRIDIDTDTGIQLVGSA